MILGMIDRLKNGSNIYSKNLEKYAPINITTFHKGMRAGFGLEAAYAWS